MSVLGALAYGVFLTHLLLPAVRFLMLLVDWSERGNVLALYQGKKKPKTFCLNEMCLCQDGGWL